MLPTVHIYLPGAPMPPHVAREARALASAAAAFAQQAPGSPTLAALPAQIFEPPPAIAGLDDVDLSPLTAEDRASLHADWRGSL